ncbi:uncharacterized protein FPRO_07525 [Fusarium proliferatum ET1]|uniref:Uncharacterized protein n=1 Tax=Fusarium proliferatum (strain ET1) TaxID=1227346 RepID=A0A1L7VT06_FUSPR|nr:uncharacterized protein FPRO_07525 [Fusarium proliferatum ET1]CZR43558.1 uncharacterized protein FPRO_07525 [Fusarium proliferatum ET1]
MSAPTNPLLLNCDAEPDLAERSLLQEASSRRGIFGYKLSNDSSVIRAFKDAFYDLTRIGKKSKDSRPLDWCFVRRVLWASCWNLDGEDRCQPDGEFRLDGIDQLGGFDWWAPGGFFQITLGWGRFSFGTAKLIDVIWDLVVGRGGQTVMALVSWEVFVQYLQLSLVMKPASYSTVWLIKMQKNNSALATWELASGFFKVGLASKKVMCFIIWTASFILAFPTFASSMTGYTPYNKAYVNSTSGRLVQFSEIVPVAYLIKDGNRVDGLSKDYPVLWIGNSETIAESSSVEIFDKCNEWDVNDTKVECQLQRDVSEYAQLYGFDGKGGRETRNGQKTYFRNQTLNWPPLNIKAFYLPNNFYWNWTYLTDVASSTTLGTYEDISASAFIVEDEIYNLKDIQAGGVCQPIKSGESIKYQWGFSFLQLFVMAILLQLWSISVFVLWVTTKQTLKRNDIGASSEGWKGLLELTDNIKEQIKSAGIIWEDLTDKELHGEIQHLLTGGPVPRLSRESEPEKTLPRGHFSVWRWMWRHKSRPVEGIYFVVFICLENILRSDGLYYHFDKGTFCMAIVLYATASMIISCALGKTYRQRLLTLLTAIVLSFPFLLYDAGDRDLVLPGLCLGVFLAFFLGSSRGSRAVLFIVPVLCNYFAVLGFFISVAKSRQSDYYRYLEQ